MLVKLARVRNLSLVGALVILNGCGPRHIDYSAGPGPQGGPHQDDQRSPQLNVSIAPYDMDLPKSSWNFAVTTEVDAYSNVITMALDPASGELAYEGGVQPFGGTFHCTAPSPSATLDQCTDMNILIPPIWQYSTAVAIPLFELNLKVHRTADCVLSAQFPWEKSPTVWAHGLREQLQLSALLPANSSIASGQQDVLELSTDPEIAEPGLMPSSLPILFADEGSSSTVPLATLMMRIPTHAANGTKISLSYEGFPAFIPAQDGSYISSFTFNLPGSSTSAQAQLTLICGAKN